MCVCVIEQRAFTPQYDWPGKALTNHSVLNLDRLTNITFRRVMLQLIASNQSLKTFPQFPCFHLSVSQLTASTFTFDRQHNLIQQVGEHVMLVPNYSLLEAFTSETNQRKLKSDILLLSLCSLTSSLSAHDESMVTRQGGRTRRQNRQKKKEG